MITYVVGNLFESPAQVLVNTVNTVGVMGKGIAKEFKRIYPAMFTSYQTLCEQKRFDVGQLWLYKTPHKWILNFPTKRHWRNPSTVEYVELGLQKFVQTYGAKGITSVAFPALGCGNGELDWETQVRPLMEKYLKKLPIDVFIYVYRRGILEPEHRTPDEVATWLRSQPSSLPFSEFMEDLNALLGRKSEYVTSTTGHAFQCIPQADGDGEPGLCLTIRGIRHIIENWQLLDLWQHIRGFGFCMEHTMPSGLEAFTPELVALLGNLEYLKPVRAAKMYADLERESWGLQLIAPTADFRFDHHFEEPVMVTTQ